MHMAHAEKLSARTLHLTKTRTMSGPYLLATWLLEITNWDAVHSKQKLAWWRVVKQIISVSMTKIKLCELCEHWIHINCNNLLYLDYRYLQNCNEPWYCKMLQQNFSFISLSSDKNFPACCTSTDNSIMLWKKLNGAKNGSLLLKPTPYLTLSVNQFNNATSEIIMAKIFLLLNFIILTRCIILKYLAKWISVALPHKCVFS